MNALYIYELLTLPQIGGKYLLLLDPYLIPSFCPDGRTINLILFAHEELISNIEYYIYISKATH